MESVRRSSSAEIYDEAAAWVARGDGDPLTVEQRRELRDWLAADSRHQGAFARAQAIYFHTERARELDGRLAAGAEVVRLPRVSRRKLVWGTAAAAAAASLGLVAVKTLESPPARYATKRGEIRTVQLSDGSAMMLNTASSALVRYSRRQREIELVEGEALFTVAKEVGRLFRVISGETVVVALGTKFSVRNLKSEPTTVVVEEGVVDVTHTAGTGVRSTKLMANMRAISYSAGAGGALVTAALEPAVLESEVAWRRGMLAFRGTTLADAVRQFNRYGDSKIVIADPAIGQLPISGLFSAYKPREFIETVALSLNLHIEVERASDRVIVRRAL